MSKMGNTGITDKRAFQYICHVFTETEMDILWTYFGAKIKMIIFGLILRFNSFIKL